MGRDGAKQPAEKFTFLHVHVEAWFAHISTVVPRVDDYKAEHSFVTFGAECLQSCRNRSLVSTLSDIFFSSSSSSYQ